MDALNTPVAERQFRHDLATKESVMNHPSYVLLYVKSPLESAKFYQKLLETEPVELSPTFALFVLSSGLKLGLWDTSTVLPATQNAVPCGELGMTVADRAALDTTCKTWESQGLEIVQQPTDMGFGYTFVALDPDDHRLRVFAPSNI
jgi:predicted enzyme related to lactoylglutathione lyase